uniref:RING-type domain-containing protein n=1 Tax=Manihot esculenta TaxID=3983 RepID=A0A2C9W6C2_MANES
MIIILVCITLLPIIIVAITFFILYILFNYFIQPFFLDDDFSNDLRLGVTFDRPQFIYNRHLHSNEQMVDRSSTIMINKLARIQLIDWLSPSLKYENESMKSKYGDCGICLEDYREGDLCRIFPTCKHIFHSNCIDVWLGKNLTCPICRQHILNK